MDEIPLHPDVSRLLTLIETAANPPYYDMPAHVARAEHERRAPVLDMAAVALPLVRDLSLAGPAGPLAARLYSADAQPQNKPVLLWLHGGGHTVGSIACYDNICRRLCAQADVLVLSLEYRLAPEHPFPAAVDDAFAALSWLSRNAEQLGGDSARLAVGGDSAGGNLAAVCALLARDSQITGLMHQLLVYPAVGPHLDHHSHRQFAEGYLLTRNDIEWFQRQYLGDAQREPDWRFAPLVAENHSDLASATIIVASHDPLRDEGIAYAERLQAAGTPAQLTIAKGMVHAFWSVGGAVRPAVPSIDWAAGKLAQALRVADS